MAGITGFNRTSSGERVDAGDAPSKRSHGNSFSSPVGNSPLKLFGIAKKQINEIFQQTKQFSDESERFLRSSTMQQLALTSTADLDDVSAINAKVNSIREVINRNQMKVAFFGRTSNGKSTSVNAMLRARILPTGIGHTTNCFLQVEPTDQSRPYILTEDNGEPKNVETIQHLAHALSSTKLLPNSLIRIFWPKDKCALLKDDVVLVDSPGIDVEPDLDSWIDKHCLDADVFVFVSNAESTMTQTEKNFFRKVSDRLSKPNIFILQNRWDASAAEPEFVDEVRKQHTERNVQFLVDELKVATQSEAENRVFFVSARETLLSRVHQEAGTPPPMFPAGFEARAFEFADFEAKFEATLSKSATRTKFLSHAEQGRVMTTLLRSLMERVYETAIEHKDESMKNRQEKMRKLQETRDRLTRASNAIERDVQLTGEFVEKRVRNALFDEIRRLAQTVNEFDYPFSPDKMSLVQYKRQLNEHVENELGKKLQTSCSHDIVKEVARTERAILERLSSIIGTEQAKGQMMGLLQPQPFEAQFHLDCRNICADFREDIEFRFSLGLDSLLKRFLSARSSRYTLRSGNMHYFAANSQSSPNLGAYDSMGPPNELPPPGYGYDSGNGNGNGNGNSLSHADLLTLVIKQSPSLMSKKLISVVVVVGVAGKAAGWKLLAFAASLYGLVYVFERLSWTNRSKERAFKAQFVEFASAKLKLIVHMTSENCSHQARQELTTVFKRLRKEVEKHQMTLEVELTDCDKQIAALEEAAKDSRNLKQTASSLDSIFAQFIDFVLQHDG